MAAVIGVKRAVQEIALDDSPDSPVFTLDLSDKAIARDFERIARLYGSMVALSDGMKSDEDYTVGRQMALASIERKIITAILGEDAYEAIIGYVACGKPAHECNLILLPLLEYLFAQVKDVVTANDSAAVRKYLGSRNEADEI